MPNAAPKPCNHPGCGKLTTHGARCELHKKQKQQDSDARRGSSASRGYGFKWQQASKGYLKSHPLCVCPHCAASALPLQANVVDHITPHRGNMALFWDKTNWQALNKVCHDSYKKRLEESGTIAGCNIDGQPLDPSHHWNQ